MVDIKNLGTEQRNEKTKDLDLLSTRQIIEIMNEEDLKVVEAIKGALGNIEALIKETIKAYKKGGRIIYIGAGTSGRLGLMDAVEVIPTFNSESFIGLLAGGDKAFVRAALHCLGSGTFTVQLHDSAAGAGHRNWSPKSLTREEGSGSTETRLWERFS